MNEIWRPIPGWEYQVSDLGRVRRNDTGNILRGSIQKGGYIKVYLCRGKRMRRNTKVHRLVCVAFHGPAPSPIHQVAHWDGTPSNNKASNLRWATPKENQSDILRHGRHRGCPKHSVQGQYKGNTKLSESDVIKIRDALASGKTHISIGAMFGVSRTAIGKISRGVTWKLLGSA